MRVRPVAMGRTALVASLLAAALSAATAWPVSGQEYYLPSRPTAEPTPMTTHVNIPDGIADKFAAFVAGLKSEAGVRGVSGAVYDRAFAGVLVDPDIFDLIANQPEHVATPWDYLARLVSDRRIADGGLRLAEHRDLLSRIEAKYGVDRHVLLAIWGIESNYGSAMGRRSVIRSLATLAVGEPRRPQFWRSELLSALMILQRGDIGLEQMTGSWAGAMGHTQFMPSTYQAHAVDFDGDGRRDIWTSTADGLASTANYLKVSGWKSGAPWGYEVVLPAGFNAAEARDEVARPAGDWQRLGVIPPFGRPALSNDGPMRLILPAGLRGPGFLVSGNFRAVLRYNNSISYALAVGHLADRLAGLPALAGTWPTDDPPLDRAARIELQKLLSGLGLDVGAADGVIGNQTRAAVRAVQLRLGLPADGYASESLLATVRRLEQP